MSKFDSINCSQRVNRKGLQISHDDRYIYLKHDKGYTFVTDYEQELYELLSSKRVLWDCNENNVVRLQYTITYCGKRCKGVNRGDLSRLIWSYYHFGTRKNNLCKSLKLMQREIEDQIVEHLDNNRLNNILANLTVTSISTNVHKSRTVDRRTQLPFVLIAAHKGDTFKAIFYWISGGLIFTNPIITSKSLESLLISIRLIMKAKPFGNYNSILENYAKIKTTEAKPMDTIGLQRKLYDDFENPLIDFDIAFTMLDMINGDN